MIRFLAFTLLSLASLWGQLPDFFPLVPGSQWLYRGSPLDGPLKIQILDTTTLNEKTYFRLRGYTSDDLLIRRLDDGSFVYWNATTKSDATFLRFDGRSYPAPVFCNPQASASPKLSPYEGPIGYFDNAATLAFTPGLCADTGTTSEVYVPNLGLVERTSTSFTGPRKFSLVYAQIGGITYLSEAAVTFSLAVTPIDARNLAARLVLTNTSPKPLKLDFTSSQIFDFTVRNEKGDAVYVWSSTRIFLAALSTIEVPTRGEQAWQETLALPTLPAGKYSIEGKLINTDGSRFLATASLTLP